MKYWEVSNTRENQQTMCVWCVWVNRCLLTIRHTRWSWCAFLKFDQRQSEDYQYNLGRTFLNKTVMIIFFFLQPINFLFLKNWMLLESSKYGLLFNWLLFHLRWQNGWPWHFPGSLWSRDNSLGNTQQWLLRSFIRQKSTLVILPHIKIILFKTSQTFLLERSVNFFCFFSLRVHKTLVILLWCSMLKIHGTTILIIG